MSLADYIKNDKSDKQNAWPNVSTQAPRVEPEISAELANKPLAGEVLPVAEIPAVESLEDQDFFAQTPYWQLADSKKKIGVSRGKLKWLLLGAVVLVLLILSGAGLAALKSRMASHRSAAITKQDSSTDNGQPTQNADLKLQIPKSSSGFGLVAGSKVYDSKKGITTYQLRQNNGPITILVTEQKAPTTLVDKKATLQDLIVGYGSNVALAVATPYQARLIVSNHDTSQGATAAYYNTAVLLFARASQSMTAANWVALFNNLEAEK